MYIIKCIRKNYVIIVRNHLLVFQLRDVNIIDALHPQGEPFTHNNHSVYTHCVYIFCTYHDTTKRFAALLSIRDCQNKLYIKKEKKNYK